MNIYIYIYIELSQVGDEEINVCIENIKYLPNIQFLNFCILVYIYIYIYI